MDTRSKGAIPRNASGVQKSAAKPRTLSRQFDTELLDTPRRSQSLPRPTEMMDVSTRETVQPSANASAAATNANDSSGSDDSDDIVDGFVDTSEFDAMNQPAGPSNQSAVSVSSGLPGIRNQALFAANNELNLPQNRFNAPQGLEIHANLQQNAPRRVVDLRVVYLNRLKGYKQRLLTEGFSAVALRTMLDSVKDCVNRITKYVEDREASPQLSEDEALINQAMCESAVDLNDALQTDILTKLEYLEAGQQPMNRQAAAAEHARRMEAKILPFGGDTQMWPNFKAKWEQYYHNCNDLTDLERFMKLDEFIVPHSETFELIASHDRSLPGAYQSAWEYLC